jgi:hypothetical protein
MSSVLAESKAPLIERPVEPAGQSGHWRGTHIVVSRQLTRRTKAAVNIYAFAPLRLPSAI